jgi:prepilin-type N-terminal cleavage/methylation domain-containing protein
VKRAFTLIELLLVLAILVVLAAAAAPVLRNTMRDAALKSAADAVRVEWTRAHVRAMKTGRIQVFRFEVGGSQFTVQPWAAADDEIESAPLVQGFGTDQGEIASPKLDTSLAITLPEGVTFASGEALAEGRALSIEEDIRDANRFEGDWSQPILFYPDGSSSDAFVIVTHADREVGIRVNLRGMTAAATLGEINSIDELQDNAELVE